MGRHRRSHGEAGDVILTHYLLPHGASHNRRARTRVAYFTRFSCPDHPFYPPPIPSVNRYNIRQLEAMGEDGTDALRRGSLECLNPLATRREDLDPELTGPKPG